jgi:hypothetical protein
MKHQRLYADIFQKKKHNFFNFWHNISYFLTQIYQRKIYGTLEITKKTPTNISLNWIIILDYFFFHSSF